MEEKKPIDRQRDSGGQSDIGTSEDGAIVEMTKIGNRLLIIKEKSIYELMLADDIDPQRTNIGLPSDIHKLLINQGSESELVSKTFLTAKNLFKPIYLEIGIDCDKALQLSLDILEELIILQKEINEYLDEEKNVSEKYNKRVSQKGSYSIPSIVNLETRCKTIFQKADHIEQILMEIITVFYPKENLTKQSHFPKLYEVLKNKYGEKDTFSEFIFNAQYFMKIIRSLRNGLDHRLDTVKIKNFELQPDSNILSPTIELNHKEDKFNRVSLSTFLPLVVQNLEAIIEISFAYLSGKNVKPSAMNYQVLEIPEDKRKNKHVKFGIWTPFGGGYYQQ